MKGPIKWGASPEAWDHFDLKLGLTADLLPVISNPHAQISPASKMQQLGKTPSRYNRKHHAAGIQNWTEKISTAEEINEWREDPDYGICVQTRITRALDCDIVDQTTADRIANVITQHLGPLPTRKRGNSPKFLKAFVLPGEYYKRRIITAHGVIEFLATGQQFIAIGTHPSGTRYGWVGALPEEIPEVGTQVFEACWDALVAEFAVEPPTVSKAPTRDVVLAQAAENDPVAVKLSELSMVLSNHKEGQLNVVCPFDDEHTEDSGETSTQYYPAHTGGYSQGNFKCLHAHCLGRSQFEFLEKIGITVADDFDVLDTKIGTDRTQIGDDPAKKDNDPEKPRYEFIPASEFASTMPQRYIVKGVLPEAQLVMIYGASGSGKTFIALDLALAIAMNRPWRDCKTVGGRVAYVCAEGSTFFRGRIKAFAAHNDVPLTDIDMFILGDAPNLTRRSDTAALIDSLRELGPLKLIVIDTLAQTMAGGDENSGTDMMKVLSHCQALHRHTGATVLVVHHAGKDETRGARGWSGLKAACDAELEVKRFDHMRTLRISKQKDGLDGTEYGFRLHIVNVGFDEDGEIITSCIVDHTTDKARNDRKGTLRGEKQELVYSIARDNIDAGGGGMTTGDLITATVKRIPIDEKSVRRDQRRNHALRALEAVIAAGYLVIDEAGYINLPSTGDTE